jgi:small subunit ribosomal protein S21
VKKRQRFEKPSEVKKRLNTAARRKRLKEIADLNRKRLY